MFPCYALDIAGIRAATIVTLDETHVCLIALNHIGLRWFRVFHRSLGV
ncbi:Uncharacterised protein [Segatella copri]|nr:Uncharacterised protein [Segatella copri]